jgi:hypothetical protein
VRSRVVARALPARAALGDAAGQVARVHEHDTDLLFNLTDN